MHLLATGARPLLGFAWSDAYPALGLGWLVLLLPLVAWLLAAFALYWVIRLGVRHGVLDAQRRRPGPRSEPASAEERQGTV